MFFSTASVVAFISAASCFAAASTALQRRVPGPEANVDDYYPHVYARSAYADIDGLRLQARDVPAGFAALHNYAREAYADFDDGFDLHARDAEPENDFEVYARDVHPSYHAYSRRTPIDPVNGMKVLNLVKANQQAKKAPTFGKDPVAFGFHATTVQKIQHAQGLGKVAAPRPPPRNYAEAQSQAYSRAWGDDPRGGHRGGGAPPIMRTGHGL